MFALDKSLVVVPVVIGETIILALAKIVLRASGDQSKTFWGNLQLCYGIKDGIEGFNNTSKNRRL